MYEFVVLQVGETIVLTKEIYNNYIMYNIHILYINTSIQRNNKIERETN